MTSANHLLFSVVAGTLAAIVVLAFPTYEKYFPRDEIRTPYEAVLLDNGAAYFGKVEQLTFDSLILTDVFYVESRTSPDTKQISNILIKRGKEWHSPDKMIISRSHVIFREPVAPDSKVARLIAGS